MTTRELIERLTDASANTVYGLLDEIVWHLEAKEASSEIISQQNKMILRIGPILSRDGKRQLMEENDALKRELDEAKKSLAEGKGE